jgi:hypothetical protein
MGGLPIINLCALSFKKIRELARRDRVRLKDKLAKGSLFGNYFVVKIKPRPRFLPKCLWHFFIYFLIDVESTIE